MNQLYYGDCLDVLKELSAEHPQPFIDLIYIDPPFNSKRNYNVLFESIDMKDATAQKTAFADTWSNVTYIDTLNEIAELDRDLWKYLTTLSEIRTSDSAVAYLTTMAIRIHYMHKLLKDTGSFYLHCDPTMGSYLRLICDLIFGEKNFQNEITWIRSSAHSDAKQGRRAYGNIADLILFYSKTDNNTFNTQYLPYSEEYINAFYHHVDSDGRKYRLGDLTAAKGGGDTSYDFHGTKPYKGRFWAYSRENMEKYKKEGRLHFPKNGGTPSYKRYLDEMPGVAAQNVWDDIRPLSGSETERLGYPTQKPQALMERIIKASSNEGDVVADFFCGCGTTIAAAQKLNRRWIGADISHLAIRLIQKRLVDTYGQGIRHSFVIKGFPADIASAKELSVSEGGRLLFQEWVIEVLMNGIVNPKKTADGGWDGYLTFETPEKKEFVIIEVKSGNVNVKNVREFLHVIETEKAAMGVFVCFEEQVTTPMQKEEKLSGWYNEKMFGQRYKRLQIITIEDLMNNKAVDMPQSTKGTFKSAQRTKDESKRSSGLFD